MKTFFYILALVIIVYGVVCAVIQGDLENFRFGIIMGMLCNIYAEVTD